MATTGSSWLLQVYLLLLLARPLDPSSHPERDMGTSGLLPEELELHDLEPEPTPWGNMALLSGICLLLELLLTGIVLGRCLGKRRWSRWREGKRHSPSAPARPCCCCRGRRCPRKLIWLLKLNRAMLRLYLSYGSQQRPRGRRAARGAVRKTRRLQVSSALPCSSSAAL